MAKNRRKPNAIAWLLAAGLTGCAGLVGPRLTWQRTTLLEPDFAAWVSAEVARRSFPGADPLPQHAAAPVVRRGLDAYVVHIGRDQPDGYRVAANGRLRAHLGAGIPAIVFEPKASSGTIGSGSDAITIVIEPSLGGGATVAMRGRGEACRHDLALRLEGSLTVAQAVQQAARLLLARDALAPAQAVRCTQRVSVAAFRAAIAPLRATLLLLRAQAQVRDGDLAAAHAATLLALAEDPHVEAPWLLQLDAHLAYPTALAGHLARLASTPGRPATAHAAGCQLQREQARNRATAPAEAAHAAANAWLTHDPAAATAWAKLAVQTDPNQIEHLRLLAAALLATDQAERAKWALLTMLTHGAPSANLAAQLAETHAALGHSAMATRWRLRANPALAQLLSLDEECTRAAQTEMGLAPSAGLATPAAPPR